MYQAGSYLAGGVKSGFLAQEASIKASVNAMMSRITASAKSKMKINSPSKVWAEIGSSMAEGIDYGFQGEIGTATRNIVNSIPTTADVTGKTTAMFNQNKSDDMVAAFKDALSQMKIELDDEVAGHFVDKTVTRLIYA